MEERCGCTAGGPPSEEDASEFFTTVVDKIDEELSILKGKFDPESRARPLLNSLVLIRTLSSPRPFLEGVCSLLLILLLLPLLLVLLLSFLLDRSCVFGHVALARTGHPCPSVVVCTLGSMQQVVMRGIFGNVLELLSRRQGEVERPRCSEGDDGVTSRHGGVS